MNTKLMTFLLALSTLESILSALFVFAVIVGAFLFFRKMKEKKQKAYQHQQNGTSPDGKSGNPEELIAAKRQEIINTLVVNEKTPLGVSVNSQRGIPAQFKKAIDDAHLLQHAAAAANGWSNVTDPKNSFVLIFPNVEKEIEKYGASFKAFFAPGDPYDGSTSDQEPTTPGGWVYAAEQVLNYAPALFIVAEYEEATVGNWGNAKRAAYHGLDHILLELNGAHTPDKRTHQNGQSFHPLVKAPGYEDNY